MLFPSRPYGRKIAYGCIYFPAVRTQNSVCMHAVFRPHGRKIAYSWTYFPSLWTKNNTDQQNMFSTIVGRSNDLQMCAFQHKTSRPASQQPTWPIQVGFRHINAHMNNTYVLLRYVSLTISVCYTILYKKRYN